MTATLSGATSLESLMGTVREAMNTEVMGLQAHADSPLAEAVLSMDRAGVDCVPVVDADGLPVGILTRDDVLRALARRIRRLRPTAARGSLMTPG
jgi:CBS domain-containing protein